MFRTDLEKRLIFIVTVHLIWCISCKKEESSGRTKSSFKNIFEFSIQEPDLNIDIYVGSTIAYPNRVSGLVCPATYGVSDITEFLVRSRISLEANIEPADSTWVDFSMPRQFTVTAEDGSDTSLWVTVGKVEGWWLKDGIVVDTMKFNFRNTLDWNTGNSSVSPGSFVFKIGRNLEEQIAFVTDNWGSENWANLPQTIQVYPLILYRKTPPANYGGFSCDPCLFTITDFDREIDTISGNWDFTFEGELVNGSVGTFKNAPLYGDF